MQQILVAVISGLCVAIPSIVATITTNKKNNAMEYETVVNGEKLLFIIFGQFT